MTTKADIVQTVYKKMSLPKPEIIKMVDEVLETIRQTLESGENVKLSGFGKFHLRDKKERIGRNPQTGEEVIISARKVVTFHPSRNFLSKLKL